jgi:chaperonin GroES
MKSIQPLNGYVVLRPIEEQEQMYGAIVMPDLGKERPEMGEVVATSKTYNYHTDRQVESAVNVGDAVMIPKLGTMKLTIDQQDYYICKETELLGIIVNQ